MMKYDYMKQEVEDVKECIRELINTAYYDSREELEDALNDKLWMADSVTGNASGSYTFCRADAREYVAGNMDLLSEACADFGLEASEIGKHFINEDWEFFDVTIRCYLLPQAIKKALDEMLASDESTTNSGLPNATDNKLKEDEIRSKFGSDSLKASDSKRADMLHA